MPLLLALLAAILAGWPAGSWAADSLVDLGQNRPVPREDQAVVGGQHAVLVSVNSTGGYGLWENGTVVIPSAPASDPTATFTPASINSLGVVVGVARTGSAHYVPAYCGFGDFDLICGDQRVWADGRGPVSEFR